MLEAFWSAMVLFCMGWSLLKLNDDTLYCVHVLWLEKTLLNFLPGLDPASPSCCGCRFKVTVVLPLAGTVVARWGQSGPGHFLVHSYTVLGKEQQSFLMFFPSLLSACKRISPHCPRSCPWLSSLRVCSLQQSSELQLCICWDKALPPWAGVGPAHPQYPCQRQGCEQHQHSHPVGRWAPKPLGPLCVPLSDSPANTLQLIRALWPGEAEGNKVGSPFEDTWLVNLHLWLMNSCSCLFYLCWRTRGVSNLEWDFIFTTEYI